MGMGTKLWASPVWGGQDEDEPAKETEEEWPGRGRTGRERHPEARLESIPSDCYCQVRMEVQVIISEAIKHFIYHMPCASQPVENFTDIILQKLHESRTPKPGVRLVEGSVGNARTQGPIGEAGGLRSKPRQGKRPALRGVSWGGQRRIPAGPQDQAPLSSGSWTLASDVSLQVSSGEMRQVPARETAANSESLWLCGHTDVCAHTHSHTHTQPCRWVRVVLPQLFPERRGN